KPFIEEVNNDWSVPSTSICILNELSVYNIYSGSEEAILLAAGIKGCAKRNTKKLIAIIRHNKTSRCFSFRLLLVDCFTSRKKATLVKTALAGLRKLKR